MAQIPKGVVSATLRDLATGKEQQLTTRANSACHFVDRFHFGGYDIQLRIDWTDLNAEGDPTLDADFYHPGETKAIGRLTKHPAHHTRKAFDPREDTWIYDFEYNGLAMKLVLRVTREITSTIDGIVVERAEQEA
jgi:hypothetical protein